MNCGRCQHFDNAPKTLEAMLPGLRVMGSGYSSVRVNDGLCAHHDRYLSADYVCDSFKARREKSDLLVGDTGIEPVTPAV